MYSLARDIAPLLVGSAAMYSILGYTHLPAMAGMALLTAAAVLAGNDPSSIEASLAKAFYACRLGVMKKDGLPDLPKLVKKIKRDYGWRLIFTIPVGMSIYNFHKDKLSLQTATNSELEMWVENGMLHMRAFTHRLPKTVQYKPFISEGVLPIPIGYSRAGLEVADLVECPHLLVGGTTGAGKSVFLHGLAYTLCHYPHVRLYMIDLKKLEFVQYRNHAWLASTVQQAVAVVTEVRSEMFRRMELLKNARVNNIAKYKEKLPYIVLIIDEFAQLWPQKGADVGPVYEMKKTAHSYLHDILSLARAVGIHCVVSTQRPDRYILPGQLKANLPATLAFRCRNMTNAEVLDTPLAALIPPEIKGRAIWNWNTDREVQVMMFDPDKHILPVPVTKPVVKERIVHAAGEV